MKYQTLRTEQTGHILTIWYNNPPKNFMTVQFLYEFRLLLMEIEKDPSVRVIVLSSDNQENFIGHSEMSELTAMTGRAAKIPAIIHPLMLNCLSLMHKILDISPSLENKLLSSINKKDLLQIGPFISMRLFNAIQHSSKITIAAINGICLGGGLELSLCFDFRLMSQGESIFISQPEILIGMIPGYGGTQRMTRIIGPARTLELQLTGEVLTAAQAVKAGLIYKAIPGENFNNEVKIFAEKMANRDPVAVASLKKAVFSAGELPLRKGLYKELAETLKSLSNKSAQQKIKKYSELIEKELVLPEDKQLKPEQILEKIEIGL